MLRTNCAICEKNNYHVLYQANFNIKGLSEKTFSARRVPDKVHYRIVKCNICGLVYSNPILSYEQLERLYKKSTYTYGDFEADLSETYARYLKTFLQKNISESTFLEIGCGNGFFLKTAQKIGFKNTYGVEPGKETVRNTDRAIKNNIIVDIFRKGQFKKESIDVICLFQVFDHIPNPNYFLTECYKILKKDGSLLCINHNVEALSAKILGESSPIFDIEHTYLYSKKTFRKIFTKNKFRVIKIFNVANRYPLVYWIKMFPFPGTLKKLLLKILKRLRLNDKKIWLYAGNIGIFVQKS